MGKRHKEIVQLVRKVVRENGWSVEINPGGSHRRLVSPEGGRISIPSSGAGSSTRNFRAELRRMGARI